MNEGWFVVLLVALVQGLILIVAFGWFLSGWVGWGGWGGVMGFGWLGFGFGLAFLWIGFDWVEFFFFVVWIGFGGV